MSERVLGDRELNRATLARQLLLARRPLPVARAVERLGALQAQYSPSPYLALWARLEGFERAQLTRALERRQVVKATLFRMTLHLFSARDYLAHAGLWFRTQDVQFSDVDAAAVEALRRRIDELAVSVDVDVAVEDREGRAAHVAQRAGQRHAFRLRDFATPIDRQDVPAVHR